MIDKAIIFIIVILICVVALISLINTEKYEVTYVQSLVDGNEYLVRDLEDKQYAADLLANLRKNIMKLTQILYQNKDTEQYKDYKKYVEQLQERIRNVIINESSEDNAYTSYSINKGEQIVFCLRSKHNGKLHDLNLLTYVAIHEMSHVGNPEFGHGDLFKKIFAFFTKAAIENGIYKKIDFLKCRLNIVV